MTPIELAETLKGIIAEKSEFTTWTVSTPHLLALVQTVQQAERQAVLDTIDALQGTEDRHPLFVEGYEYALRHIEEFIKGRT